MEMLLHVEIEIKILPRFICLETILFYLQNKTTAFAP